MPKRSAAGSAPAAAGDTSPGRRERPSQIARIEPAKVLCGPAFVTILVMPLDGIVTLLVIEFCLRGCSRLEEAGPGEGGRCEAEGEAQRVTGLRPGRGKGQWERKGGNGSE